MHRIQLHWRPKKQERRRFGPNYIDGPGTGGEMSEASSPWWPRKLGRPMGTAIRDKKTSHKDLQ